MAFEISWAYFAGLLDGEGSMAVYQNGPRLSVTNTHKPALEWVQTFTGHGRIWEMKQHKANLQATKPCYQWDCSSRAIRIILPQTIPYMIIKRVKAELLLEYVSGIEPSTNKTPSEMELQRRADLIQRMKGV